MPTKQKYLCLSLLFVVAGSVSSLHAAGIGKESLSFQKQSGKWGLGVEGGLVLGAFVPAGIPFASFPDSWLALTLHIPKVPVIFSAGVAGLGFGGYGLNVNADFFLGGLSITNWFELHLFLGAGASIYSYSNGIGLSVGARLPLGMSFWLWRWFQIYFNITPIAGLGIGFGNPPRFWIHFEGPIDLGVRFWFKGFHTNRTKASGSSNKIIRRNIAQ